MDVPEEGGHRAANAGTSRKAAGRRCNKRARKRRGGKRSGASESHPRRGEKAARRAGRFRVGKKPHA